MVLGKIGINLRTRTVYEYELNAKTMQQRKIMNQMAKIVVIDRFAIEHNDKGLATMSVDIGRKVTKP